MEQKGQAAGPHPERDPADRRLWLRTICRRNGLSPTDTQLDLIVRYVTELLRWNSQLNLISRRDEEQIWERHILHSLAILFQVVLPPDVRYLDVGTGGGLPGIPLSIFLPNAEWILVDATRKKVNAVNEMIAALGLSRVRAAWGRAEDLGRQKEFAGSFDVAVARGVAPLDELIPIADQFLRRAEKGGVEKRPLARFRSGTGMSVPLLLALKGGALGSEISKAERVKGVKRIAVSELRIDGAEDLALVEKKLVAVEFAESSRPTK